MICTWTPYSKLHPYTEPDDEKFTESSGSPGPSDLTDFEKPCDRADTKVNFLNLKITD